ncbi:hypothetical protein V8G54_020656 [Vigna mungo]|uniref:Uncharacterized protein n=1 Tax=Vigna mungo TaxID=3915 RepID=A0AAQ3NCK4_VIGMU
MSMPLDFETLSSKLLRLEVLDIRSNYLTNDILPSLRGFTSLKELYLSDNELDSDNHMQDISKITSLEILDIEANQLNETILWHLEKDAFTWPPNLQVLTLSLNSFSNEFLSSLTGLQRLKSLDLSYNQLNGLLDISG